MLEDDTNCMCCGKGHALAECRWIIADADGARESARVYCSTCFLRAAGRSFADDMQERVAQDYAKWLGSGMPGDCYFCKKGLIGSDCGWKTITAAARVPVRGFRDQRIHVCGSCFKKNFGKEIAEQMIQRRG